MCEIKERGSGWERATPTFFFIQQWCIAVRHLPPKSTVVFIFSVDFKSLLLMLSLQSSCQQLVLIFTHVRVADIPSQVRSQSFNFRFTSHSHAWLSGAAARFFLEISVLYNTWKIFTPTLSTSALNIVRDCPLSATERFPSPRHEHGTVCQPKWPHQIPCQPSTPN